MTEIVWTDLRSRAGRSFCDCKSIRLIASTAEAIRRGTGEASARLGRDWRWEVREGNGSHLGDDDDDGAGGRVGTTFRRALYCASGISVVNRSIAKQCRRQQPLAPSQNAYPADIMLIAAALGLSLAALAAASSSSLYIQQQMALLYSCYFIAGDAWHRTSSWVYILLVLTNSRLVS